MAGGLIMSAAAVITIVGWLVSPIIGLLLAKIIAYLDFDLELDTSDKLQKLKNHIIPELHKTLRAVDQERMMEREKKPAFDLAALDNMAAMLRHALEDTEDIFDVQQEIELYRNRLPQRLYGAVSTCFARINRTITPIIPSGSVRLRQWATAIGQWNTSLSQWFLRRSEEPVPLPIDAAASGESAPVTIDIADSDEEILPATTSAAASDESVLLTISAAPSHEPAVSTSDSSGQWLSCLFSSFDFVKNCCRSSINWFHFYRDWSYEALDTTSYQENASTIDFLLTAISRRNLKKRIDKVESIVTELKESPLLGVTSKSELDSIANKNRTDIKSGGDRPIFGRDGLRDFMMAKLCETPHGDALNSGPCYSGIGLYGISGSGKTAFVLYLLDYIKKECKTHFNTFMIIHVSKTINVNAILNEMLKAITKNSDSSVPKKKDSDSIVSDCAVLKEELKKALSGKRFLLILDDLWVDNKNDPQLEEILSPLSVGKKGSKILVTAQSINAARVLCADEPIKIPDLDEKHQFMPMFMYYALNGASVDDEFLFRSVGDKIAKNLHRSPIAAVTVAGRLRANLNIGFWRNTALFDMSKNSTDALWWSYQQLNPDIRRCLEYCTLFPRRLKLRMQDLICLWIAQGFVKASCETDNLEDVAEGYIQELVSFSFLQPGGDAGHFTVHDLLHDLARKITGRDYHRIEKVDDWNKIPRDVRHLFVQNYDGKLITEKILGLENLRTLIIDVVEENKPVEEKVTESICKRLPKLRVLAIAFSQQPDIPRQHNEVLVPESIIQLKHLHYLAFRMKQTCIVILPSALAKLHHIQLLDFGGGRISTSEFTFAGLINLRYIFWSRLVFPDLGRLISLQTLRCFTVRNKQGYELKQLRDLNKLRGRLEIMCLGSVKSKEEAVEANLVAKERLTELVFGWSPFDDDTSSPEVQEEVLKGLCPPMGLQKLTIIGYEGLRYPDWMVGKQDGVPADLQELTFMACGGAGPELEAFCHIRRLKLWYSSWDALPGSMVELTSLKELILWGCKNIRSLPTLPKSLEVFHLLYCKDEFMLGCQTVGHPDCHKIRHIRLKFFEPPIPSLVSQEDSDHSDEIASEEDFDYSDGIASEEDANESDGIASEEDANESDGIASEGDANESDGIVSQVVGLRLRECAASAGMWFTT